jgi:amidase
LPDIRRFCVRIVVSNRSDIGALSAREVVREIKLRTFSCSEVSDHFIERLGETKSLNAIAYLNREDVSLAARELDKRLDNGEDLPLLGLPLSIKDSIAVKGWPWRSGSIARENVVAQEDATVVRRLRDAGALLLCKSTTPEYTWSVETDSVLHGATLNPYNTQKTSGGSSGGEAVIHAIGGAPAGLGSDGFNSIRVPAHFCGTTGLRPTSGVIPETGVWPTTRASGMMDISTIGPMARFADDLDLLLDFIEGPDGLDPFVHPLGSRPRLGSLRGATVGFWPTHAIDPASHETSAAVHLAADVLKDLGATIREIPAWPLGGVIDLAFRLMAPDGGRRATRDVQSARGRHSSHFSFLLKQLKSQELSASQYLAAVDQLIEVRTQVRQSLEDCDLVICPVTSGTAPTHSSSVIDGMPGLSVEGYAYSFVVAIAGVPSVSVPILLSSSGMPIGVQVVSSPHFDRVAVGAAAAIQGTLGLLPHPTIKA